MAATFPITIVTPDGSAFAGNVTRFVCRTITGDLAIMAGHTDYCTAIGMGEAHFLLEDGTVRSAACMGGMLSVIKGECRVLATTWEWAEEIDKDRAAQSRARAEELLKQSELGAREVELAQARLKRALVRTSVAK